jgi:hypothetical protein
MFISSVWLTIILFSFAATLAGAMWLAHRGWDLADTLRALIELSPQVCYQCGQAHNTANDTTYDHPYVPASLVFIPEDEQEHKLLRDLG